MPEISDTDAEMLERVTKRPRAASIFSCPQCGSHVVRRGRRRHLRDIILSWFGLYPWSCRECKAKFWLRARKDDSLPSKRKKIQDFELPPEFDD